MCFFLVFFFFGGGGGGSRELKKFQGKPSCPISGLFDYGGFFIVILLSLFSYVRLMVQFYIKCKFFFCNLGSRCISTYV